MKKIILLTTLILTINLSANPFNNFGNRQQIVSPIVQKFIFAREAARLGNIRAEFDLGLMYAKGEGVQKNERLAFLWFHKAARNNHTEAKFYMGLSFEQGRGVRKQTQLARYWFKLAAKAGHREAMAHLASIEYRVRLQYGRGVRVSFNTYR